MGYKQYCKCYEKIENFEKAKADDFKGWNCHHRLETHTASGERRSVNITKKELIALKMYYSRPPEELIFLTSREHRQLHKKGKHNPMYGKTHSKEVRNRISEANKGKPKPKSEETRRRMSEVHKGKQLTEETRRKMSEARKGMCWFNNGKTNIKARECPDGFTPGRIKKRSEQ